MTIPSPFRPKIASALVALASATLLGGAFAFQHWGGLAPCPLCVWQRFPHGAAIALGLIGAFAPVRAARLVLLLAALALATGAAIGIFHAGVEWGWWHGLAECAGGGAQAGSLAEIESELAKPPAPRCDEPAWTLFGISLAGYNVLASAAFAAVAVRASCKGERT